FAKQKCDRGTNVVQTPQIRLSELLFRRQVKPHTLAVADKQLHSWRTVLPTHLARLFQPQCTRFLALGARSAVDLGKVSFQAAQMVVMVVDRLGELVDIQ